MKKFIAVLIVLIICFGVFACSLYDPFDNTYDDIKNEVEGAFEDALHEFASPSPSTCASSTPSPKASIAATVEPEPSVSTTTSPTRESKESISTIKPTPKPTIKPQATKKPAATKKAETTIKPAETKKPVSTNKPVSATVYVGATGTKYHRQSCPTLKGKGHAISLEEAKNQGRTPCKVCKPS